MVSRQTSRVPIRPPFEPEEPSFRPSPYDDLAEPSSPVVPSRSLKWQRARQRARRRRSWAALALIVFVVLIGFLIVGVIGRFQAPPAASPTPVRAAAHFFFTLHPWKGPRWNSDDRERTARELAGIFTSGAFEESGLVVVAGDGTLLFTHRSMAGMAPASTLKLLVAATALAHLGPEHRFSTSFTANALPDARGVLAGPLWLVGEGDPLLRSDELRAGVNAVVRAGVRRVEGGLIIDDSAFTGPERSSLWDPSDLPFDYAAAASAVSIDQGVVELDVTPTFPGEAAQIRVVPPNPNVRISGSILTVGSNGGSFINLTRGTSTSLAGLPTKNVFDVSGRVALGAPAQFFEPVLGLGSYIGGAASEMFAKRGVRLAGVPQRGTAPTAPEIRLWSHRSQSLREILRDMLVNSNNHSAEQLLRIIGEANPVNAAVASPAAVAPNAHAATTIPPGSPVAGVAAERALLGDLGIPTPNFRIVDGSGLSPSNRIAATTLAQLLAKVASSNVGDEYIRALPRVGLEGTVRYHELGDALGRVRAKSGHIDGVSGLAGYVMTAHHGRVAFAFIVNGPRCDDGDVTDEEDAALRALAHS
ncbi:MAG TPA: D-alanyl-D-alanine carboxypeptidase/D-alanyl-D-alanine-endopeptidase [Candidatus Baltobacteraceae bacterium]|jgi:D-alanyl-D-alanine carboxypeptidase/D-alanyl-D-alanine-endopeptidase (penicillin-binding protein 4)|nr:D-alanyl-D-alanine carboxypeptidase/D-alanyl-D-alanine-endopeptidase [Candidatus Baltobacteraceae bacterium]